ncbi:hypothetical protein CUC76_11435 [Enterobacteriaceae bacterium S05]|nr:hypothetical protein CUC76_11435 [Enterobacteriaceae bacterium S05]
MTQSRRPAQAQRRRAITADAEPLLCRVAANALPDLRLGAICQPGSTLERRIPRQETWRRKVVAASSALNSRQRKPRSRQTRPGFFIAILPA